LYFSILNYKPHERIRAVAGGTTINSKKAPNSRPINISPTVLAPVGY